MGAERFSATPCKNVTRGNFGSDFPANVGESKGIGSACRMSSRRREWKFGSVNPGNGSSEKAKLEMVIDGGQVAALRIKRADFVLDFLESAFDFPSGGIIFDHPFGRERKIGRDQRESKVAVVNEDDFDPAFQCFGHADDLGKRDLAFLTVHMNFSSPRLISELSGKFSDVRESFPIPGSTPALFYARAGKIENGCGNPQPGQDMNGAGNMRPDFFDERSGTKPGIGNDKDAVLRELSGNADDPLGGDAGFGLEPFRIRQLGAGFDLFCERLVKPLCEGQECPAVVDKAKQPDYDSAVSPDVFGRVHFGGMIEMSCAILNLFPGFRAELVVKRQKNTPVNRRIAEFEEQRIPKFAPRDFSGIDEIVKPFEREMAWNEIGKTPEYRADSSGLNSGDKSDDDDLENGLTIKWDFVGCLTEQFVEFHHCFLQLVAICGNIAQSTFGVAISGIDNQRLTFEI